MFYCRNAKKSSKLIVPIIVAEVVYMKEMSVEELYDEFLLFNWIQDINFISQSAQYRRRHDNILSVGIKRDENRNESILQASTYYVGRVYCIINKLYETTIRDEINWNI